MRTRSPRSPTEISSTGIDYFSRTPGVFLNEYAVLRAQAVVHPSDDAWDLLNGLAKVYVSPDTEFPAPKGPGYVVRYSVERIGGVGPWVGGLTR